MVALLEQGDQALDVTLCLVQQVVGDDDHDHEAPLLRPTLEASSERRRSKRVGGGIAPVLLVFGRQLIEKVSNLSQLDKLRNSLRVVSPDIRGRQEQLELDAGDNLEFLRDFGPRGSLALAENVVRDLGLVKSSKRIMRHAVHILATRVLHDAVKDEEPEPFLLLFLLLGT